MESGVISGQRQGQPVTCRDGTAASISYGSMNCVTLHSESQPISLPPRLFQATIASKVNFKSCCLIGQRRKFCLEFDWFHAAVCLNNWSAWLCSQADLSTGLEVSLANHRLKNATKAKKKKNICCCEPDTIQMLIMGCNGLSVIKNVVATVSSPHFYLPKAAALPAENKFSSLHCII